MKSKSLIRIKNCRRHRTRHPTSTLHMIHIKFLKILQTLFCYNLHSNYTEYRYFLHKSKLIHSFMHSHQHQKIFCLYSGIDVRTVTACHFLISSFIMPCTILSFCSLDFPSNALLSTKISNDWPQPPDLSRTCALVPDTENSESKPSSIVFWIEASYSGPDVTEKKRGKLVKLLNLLLLVLSRTLCLLFSSTLLVVGARTFLAYDAIGLATGRVFFAVRKNTRAALLRCDIL